MDMQSYFSSCYGLSDRGVDVPRGPRPEMSLMHLETVGIADQSSRWCFLCFSFPFSHFCFQNGGKFSCCVSESRTHNKKPALDPKFGALPLS